MCGSLLQIFELITNEYIKCLLYLTVVTEYMYIFLHCVYFLQYNFYLFIRKFKGTASDYPNQIKVCAYTEIAIWPKIFQYFYYIIPRSKYLGFQKWFIFVRMIVLGDQTSSLFRVHFSILRCAQFLYTIENLSCPQFWNNYLPAFSNYEFLVTLIIWDEVDPIFFSELQNLLPPTSMLQVHAKSRLHCEWVLITCS